ncbi:MAG: S8 family serine peptidase [Patescibacteria group bacterium]
MQRTLDLGKTSGFLLALVLLCSSWLLFAANTRAAEGEEIRGDNLKPEVITLKEDKEAYSEKSKELGYRPGEIRIKFKKDAIDLGTEEGKKQAEEWLAEKTKELLPTLTEKLKKEGYEPPADFQGEMFTIKDQTKSRNVLELKFMLSDRVEDIVAELEKDPDLEYVSINHSEPLVIEIMPREEAETEDPSFFFESFSSLDNSLEKLTTFTSATEVVIAVIDTGVDYEHTDLSAYMWDGSASCKDKDGDTIVEGCPNHGWDLGENDNDPNDNVGHGTNVAGVIKAQSNLDSGIEIKIIAIKISDGDGVLNPTLQANAIDFAKENGAQIINASWGTTTSDQDVSDAIQSFQSAGGIFVTIAGNGSIVNGTWNGIGYDLDDINTDELYPCAYDLDNIICVNSMKSGNDDFDDRTNWGATSVDIAALGENILTTNMGGGYVYATGSSVAAPQVAGLAARLWGNNTGDTYSQLITRVYSSGTYDSELDSSTGAYPISTSKKVSDGDLIPAFTFHSTTAGGYWDSYSTWEENSGLDCGVDDCTLPGSSDIVEINGTVILTTSHTISGLLVNSGVTLRDHSSYSPTLTVNGSIWNKGTIQSSSPGQLFLEVSGSIANDGTWIPYQTKLLDNVQVINTTTLGGYLDCNGSALIVNSPSVVTLSGITQGTSTYNGSGIVRLTDHVYGTISGDISELQITGSGKYMDGTTITIDKVKIKGNTYIQGNTTTTINGELEVDSGITFRSYASYTPTLVINGSVSNSGTISNSVSGTMYVELAGNLENLGTWSVSGTKLLSDIEVLNTTTINGGVNNNGYTLIVNSPHTVTLTKDIINTTHVFNGSGIVQLTGKLNGGTISGSLAEFKVAGANQYFSGTITISHVIFEATSILNASSTITGNVEVNSGVTLRNHSDYSPTLTIYGNITNNGTIQNGSSNNLTVNISGNIQNNGTWINNHNQIIWDPIVNKDHYELAFTQDPENWPVPTTVSNDYYEISDRLNSSYYWKVRAQLTDSSYTDWGTVHTINVAE